MQVLKEFQMIRDVTDEDIEHYIESTGSMLINLIGNMDGTVKEVSCYNFVGCTHAHRIFLKFMTCNMYKVLNIYRALS